MVARVARQKSDPHLPIHGLRDSSGTRLVRHQGVRAVRHQASGGVARTLRPGDDAPALRAPYRRRVGEGHGGLDEVTRAALAAAQAQAVEDEAPALDNIVSLAGRRK